MADVITQTYDRVFGGEKNLSLTERGVSVVFGLGLAAAAATPRPNPLLNVLALLGGSYLALRGASGHCPIKAALAGSDQSRIAQGSSSSRGRLDAMGQHGSLQGQRAPMGA